MTRNLCCHWYETLFIDLFFHLYMDFTNSWPCWANLVPFELWLIIPVRSQYLVKLLYPCYSHIITHHFEGLLNLNWYWTYTIPKFCLKVAGLQVCATAPGWKRKGKGPGKPQLYFNLLQLLSVASQRLSCKEERMSALKNFVQLSMVL